MKMSARVVLMTTSLTSLMLGWTMTGSAQERMVFIAEGRIGNAAIQSNVWQAGDFEYDLSTNTAAPSVQGHYPWPNGETVPFEVRYDTVSGRAQMQVGWGTNLVWVVPGEPLTSNGVVNIRLGGRGGSVAPGELRLADLQWETNGVLAVALTNEFVAVAGGGYQTGLISGLPAATQWRLSGQVRMTWPDGTLPARNHIGFQLAFTEWRVNVRGDTNRDGVVDGTDEAGKAELSVARGAFVPVNQWVATDADLARLPAVNVWELAPVVLGPVGAVPEDWTVRVRMLGLARMRLVSADKATRIEAVPAVFTTNANWLATGVQLYGATEYERAGRANHDRQRVIVELVDGAGQVMARDEAVWEIAPVIMAWNSLPLESLYCSGQFPNAVAVSKQARKPGGGQWVQDYMELALAWWRNDAVLNQVVNLEHSAAGRNFIDGTLMAEGEAPTLLPWHKTTWDNGGNGGNIEVFPPYTESDGKYHPLGRVVLGTQNKDALPQIQAQGLQNPGRLHLEVEELEEVGVAPAGGFLFGASAHFVGLVAAQDV